jgi:hypothetical protein
MPKIENKNNKSVAFGEKKRGEARKQKRGGEKTWTTEEMISVVKKNFGLVYRSAEELGCSHTAIYRRAADCPELKEAIETARDILIDDGEFALASAIREGRPWAVQFVLKTIGKSRGYVERHEHTGADGRPVLGANMLTDAELERIVGAKDGGK